MSRASTSARSRSGGASIAASAGAGVLAAAIGYLVTYLLAASEAREQVGEVAAEWQGVAWFYYNAHLVDIESTGGANGIFEGTSTTNLIAESGETSAQLLYVVPPVVLLAIGAILAFQLGARDLGEGVLAGAPVAGGYAVVMAIGAVVTESEGQGSFFGVEISGSMAPEFVPAVLLAGVLYPLVFATLGAVAVAALNR